MATTLINGIYPRLHIVPGGVVATGFMLAVTTSTATSFLAANFSTSAELITFDVQGANVLCTFDGASPSQGTAGHILGLGNNYTFQLSTVLAAKFVSIGTTASLYASQWSM